LDDAGLFRLPVGEGEHMKTTIDMAREVDPVTKLLLDKKLPQGMDHDVFMWFLERFEALVRADERGRMCEQLKECSSEKPTSNEANRSAVLGEGGQAN
jgi:hypothetical protein